MKKILSAMIGAAVALSAASVIPVAAQSPLSESALKSRLASSCGYKMEGWVYRDFDGDGVKEGFAAFVEYVEPEVNQIRFIDGYGNVTMMTDKCGSYLQHDQTPVVTVQGKSFVSFDTGTGAGIHSLMFGVKNGKGYELKISGHTSCLIQKGSTVYTYRTSTEESQDQVPLRYDSVNQEFIKDEVYYFTISEYPGSNHELTHYNGYAKHISIPEQDYAGRTITTVEARCLTYDGFYSSITIPKTVTSIGSKSIGWYYDDSYNAVKIKGLVIRGYSGTAAERYANSNGFRFFALDKNSLPSGDLNSDGKANASDASKILVAAARLGSGSSSGLSSSQTAAADANLDGTINASDAAMILVYAAKAGAGAFSGSFTSYLNSPMF